MAGKGNGKLVAEIMRRLSFEDLEALKTEWGNTELNIIGFTDSILRLLDLSSAERVAFTKGLVDVFRSVAANKKTSKVTFADCNQYFVMVQQATYCRRTARSKQASTRRNYRSTFAKRQGSMHNRLSSMARSKPITRDYESPSTTDRVRVTTTGCCKTSRWLATTSSCSASTTTLRRL